MSVRRPVLASLLLVCTGLFLQALPAGAYVRSRSNGCNPVFWAQSCVYITPSSELVPDLTPAETLSQIQASIDAWETLKPNSFLKLKLDPPSGVKEVHFDKVPVIKFRTQTWCRPGDCGAKQTCYDGSAAAITTVFFVDNPQDKTHDGEILDADIELNAVDNRFYNADNGVPTGGNGRTLADLRNTLTHELGHLQGLDHTCRISDNDGTPACVVDNTGARAPICSEVLANQNRDPVSMAIANTTMFATAAPMETKKRMPKADDVQAVTDAYPIAQDPQICQQPTAQDPCGKTSTPGGGCASVPLHQATSFAGLFGLCGLLLSGLLLLRGRRRGSPCRNTP